MSRHITGISCARLVADVCGIVSPGPQKGTAAQKAEEETAAAEKQAAAMQTAEEEKSAAQKAEQKRGMQLLPRRPPQSRG